MRLIDADAIKTVDYSGLAFIYPDDYRSIVDYFYGQLIKDQPTAFDVDKVVEQLEEYERYIYDTVSDEDNYVIDTEKAIEIVKGAVKDE